VLNVVVDPPCLPAGAGRTPALRVGLLSASDEDADPERFGDGRFRAPRKGPLVRIRLAGNSHQGCSAGRRALRYFR